MRRSASPLRGDEPARHIDSGKVDSIDSIAETGGGDGVCYDPVADRFSKGVGGDVCDP